MKRSTESRRVRHFLASLEQGDAALSTRDGSRSADTPNSNAPTHLVSRTDGSVNARKRRQFFTLENVCGWLAAVVGLSICLVLFPPTGSGHALSFGGGLLTLALGYGCYLLGRLIAGLSRDLVRTPENFHRQESE